MPPLLRGAQALRPELCAPPPRALISGPLCFFLRLQFCGILHSCLLLLGPRGSASHSLPVSAAQLRRALPPVRLLLPALWRGARTPLVSLAGSPCTTARPLLYQHPEMSRARATIRKPLQSQPSEEVTGLCSVPVGEDGGEDGSRAPPPQPRPAFPIGWRTPSPGWQWEREPSA